MKAWRTGSTPAYTVVLVTLALGCGDRKPIGAGTGGSGASGVPDGGAGQTGGGAGGTGVGGGAGQNQACATPGGGPIASRRIVRMTLRQIANSVGVMFGDAQMKAIEAKYPDELLDPSVTHFPPLNGTREGTTIIPARWVVADDVAATTGKYVSDNFATVTGCATASDDCAKTYVATLAESAYRRPLDQVEREELVQEYADLKAMGSTIPEATQFSVYAILSAPQFLYRWELGGTAPVAAAAEVPLSAYEIASALSFFLGDAPPDQAMREAARLGSLSQPAGVSQEVNRLLATPAVQANLSAVMSFYFKFNLLDGVVIDTTVFPEFTPAVRAAMATETRMFLDETLWRGKLGGVLTSRAGFVNSDLATVIYGIPAPTGATPTTFVSAELPDTRPGLLTRPSFLFLTTTSSPSNAFTLMRRGQLAGESLECFVQPPYPDDPAVAAGEAAQSRMLSSQSPQQQVDHRASMPACVSCHGHWDPYGLMLANYDSIGRYRPIGSSLSATLPPAAGGGRVTNAAELGAALVSSGAFSRCLTKSMLQYALSDASSSPVALDSCAVSDATARVNASPDPTFTDLLRAVATSKAVATRRGN